MKKIALLVVYILSPIMRAQFCHKIRIEKNFFQHVVPLKNCLLSCAEQYTYKQKRKTTTYWYNKVKMKFPSAVAVNSLLVSIVFSLSSSRTVGASTATNIPQNCDDDKGIYYSILIYNIIKIKFSNKLLLFFFCLFFLARKGLILDIFVEGCVGNPPCNVTPDSSMEVRMNFINCYVY